MEAGTYNFSGGAFTCIAARDGGFNYPVASLFADATQSDVVESLQEHHLPTDRIFTPYTCLLEDTGAHRVMIDTGAGSLSDHAAKVAPGIDHSTTVTGQLTANLATAGVDPLSVDTVIVTHAHPDHIGGTLDDSGAPVFANARYVIGRAEWDFWSSERAADLAPELMITIARNSLDPVRERLELVDDGAEVVPGIRIVSTPGHTPGHLAVEITSGDETLLHISDVVIHPLHLEHPDWVPVFDMLPEQAHTSKRRTFDRTADEKFLVFGHHFPPFPNLGHVRRKGSGWRWEPLDTKGNPDQ